MKWYKVYLNGENRIWKKCITYSWEFMHENEEINFQEIVFITIEQPKLIRNIRV